MDFFGHGTHCAGIIAAKAKSSSQYAPQGIAPGVKIMPLRIASGRIHSRGIRLSDAAAAIKYAADNGAQMTSNSWYLSNRRRDSPQEIEILSSALRYAATKGLFSLPLPVMIVQTSIAQI